MVEIVVIIVLSAAVCVLAAKLFPLKSRIGSYFSIVLLWCGTMLFPYSL